MKPFLTLLSLFALSGCSVLASVPASNCGWVTDNAGDKVWSCQVTTTSPAVKE